MVAALLNGDLLQAHMCSHSLSNLLPGLPAALTSCSSHLTPPLQTPPTALTSPRPATREPSRVRGPGRCCSAAAGTCASAGGATLLGLLPSQCTPVANGDGCHALLNFAAGLKIPRVPSWNESDANIAKKVRVLQPCAHENRASMAASLLRQAPARGLPGLALRSHGKLGYVLPMTRPNNPGVPPSPPYNITGLLPAQPAAHRPGDRGCAGL